MLIFFFILILLFSTSIHEFMHAFIADKLGDPTPRLKSRLTLNPFKHLDLLGSLILPFSLFLLTQGTFCFGYAKPIPLNPFFFKKIKRDIMLVSIGGPFINLLFSLIFYLLIKLFFYSFLLKEIFLYGFFLNLILFIFNLIPIPPLDGSKILAYFLPNRFYYNYISINWLGIIILIILFSLGLLDKLIIPLIYNLIKIIGI